MLRTRLFKAAAVAAALGLIAMGPALAANGPSDNGNGGKQSMAGQFADVGGQAADDGQGPGSGNGGGGGPPDGVGPGAGEDEGAGNNLSYPVIWSEDEPYRLTLRGTELVPAVSGETDQCTEGGTGTAYLQKEEDNTWQAENEPMAGTPVDLVNWGDALEATDANSKMQRVETSLYADLGSSTMTGYQMCKTNDVSGVGEMWGAVGGSGGLTEMPVSNPLIYTAGARLTIQRIVPDREYGWDTTTHQWTGCGADDAVVNMAVHEKTSDGPGSYGVEVSISGNITYGYVWRTDGLPTGEYRLTFSLDGLVGDFPGSGTTLSQAEILLPEEEAIEAAVAAAAEEEEGGAPGANTAYVRQDLNLTYIDVGLGTRTDPVPTDCSVTPPPSGGGGSTPAAPAAPAPVQVPAEDTTEPEVVNPGTTPQAATALIAQKAKIKAKKSGKYPVGKVIVLAKRPVKTNAGVTVRWRATVKSLDNCTVKVRKGKATVKFTDPGRCRVIGWAPAPSPAYERFRVTRTYRVVR